MVWKLLIFFSTQWWYWYDTGGCTSPAAVPQCLYQTVNRKSSVTLSRVDPAVKNLYCLKRTELSYIISDVPQLELFQFNVWTLCFVQWDNSCRSTKTCEYFKIRLIPCMRACFSTWTDFLYSQCRLTPIQTDRESETRTEQISNI